MGPPSILTKEEENILVKWIIDVGKTGFPVTVDEFLNSVQQLMQDLKRKNPFKNNRSDKTWFKGFIRRNANISRRIAHNLTVSRASVTKETISKVVFRGVNLLKGRRS